jgi:hypothetical protein
MAKTRIVKQSDGSVASFGPDNPPPMKRWGGQTPKAESFPVISEFDRADMDRARELMEEELAYHEQEDAVKEARKAIKKELAVIARKYGAAGMRWAQLVTYVKEKRSRRFSIKLAAEVIDAETLAACYAMGEPYDDVRVVDLAAPKKPKTEGGSRYDPDGDDDY